MKKNKEIYVSIDVEADGPSPGLNNLMSVGCAAFDIDKRLIGTFSRNISPLPDCKSDERTMSEFWDKNRVAWFEATTNAIDAKIAMEEFAAWLDTLPQLIGQTTKNYIFVGYPAVYDFKWIDYYCNRFLGHNPFSFSRAIDVKSYAWAVLGGDFIGTSKRKFPKEWFDDYPHTHVALDDAIEQGRMFINMVRWQQKMTKI